MSLLDGVKKSLQNPLLDNERDFELAMECDFEAVLEKAVERQLSDADIAAILAGEDDLPDDEDAVEDLDDPQDNIEIEDIAPATEGITAWLAKHNEKKLDKAKVTVMMDDLQKMQPDNAVRKFVVAMKDVLVKNDKIDDLKTMYATYHADDDDTTKTFMKTFNGYPIVYVTKNDKLVQIVCVIVASKGNVVDVMNITSIARMIVNPPKKAEVEETVKPAAESIDDVDSALAALEAMTSGESEETPSDDNIDALIAECDAAAEACGVDAPENEQISTDAEELEVTTDEPEDEDVETVPTTSEEPDDEDDDFDDAFENLLNMCTESL